MRKCAVCRRTGSIGFQGHWYCLFHFEEALGVIPRLRADNEYPKEAPLVPGKGVASRVDLGDRDRPGRRKPKGPGEKAAPCIPVR